MLVIARTVAHLFRQLRAQDRHDADLELVRRSYDFAARLHSGRFEVDGTPFQVHGIGVASVISQLGAPAAVVAAATLHNGYTTGDWGDGRTKGPLPSRRRRLQAELGPEIEAVLHGLSLARAASHVEASLDDPATEVDEAARWLVLLDLADLLDKWDDGRVAYSTDGRSDRDLVEGRERDITALAERLGGPVFADCLRTAFERVAAEEIPDALRLGRRYSEVVPAPSWQPRISVVVMRRARLLRGRLQDVVRSRPPDGT